MQVTLSDGTIVSLSERFTHRMNRAFLSALNPDMQGTVNVKGIIDGVEAVLPLMIEWITAPSGEVPFESEWLDDLLAEDYDKLQAAVIEIKSRGSEEGKKNRQ